MSSDFFALLHRLRYIDRWGLMRNTVRENVQEHSHEVAVLAHLLALARQRFFAAGRVCPEPAQVALVALYHDVTEIVTGDLPTPVKYFTPAMRSTYGDIEKAAARHLLSRLPAALQDDYRPLLLPPADGPENAAIQELVKAADRLSALIKCSDEQNRGNREFDRATRHVKEKLDAMRLPEVDWFLQEILPSYRKSLDELGDALEKPRDV